MKGWVGYVRNIEDLYGEFPPSQTAQLSEVANHCRPFPSCSISRSFQHYSPLNFDVDMFISSRNQQYPSPMER